jgi:serine-type D-Ala-D-Ala carboxypeptidase/endopeptidase
VTKTITALLLAESVGRGETELEATIGSILGDDADAAAEVTLLELATQRSGLPRLPANLDPAAVDANDPYASYTESDLFGALADMPKPSPGKYEYSNFGFMLLGLVLGRIAGMTFAELVRTRVFDVVRISRAVCGVPESGEFMPGYHGAEAVPWWSTQLPGAGGIGMSIRDLATYTIAHLDPPETIREAIELVTTEQAPPPSPTLAWVLQGGGHWHNGGTGGFRSFVAFHRPTQTAVVLLANSREAEMIDGVGFKVLTELARSRS